MEVKAGRIYATLLVWIEDVLPGFHDEWVIDTDNEHLAGILKALRVHVARNVFC